MRNQSLYLLAGAALASISLATPTVAQYIPPPAHAVGSNQAIDREYNSKIRLNALPKEAREMTAADIAAKCLAKEARGKAAEMVGGPMTDDAEFKRLSKGLFGRYRTCAPTVEGVPLLLISGALAEELVRLKQPALQPHAVPADPAAAKAFYASSGGLTIDSLARCLAVYSPGLAYRVLATRIGTADEKAALSQLYAEDSRMRGSQNARRYSAERAARRNWQRPVSLASEGLTGRSRTGEAGAPGFKG